MNKTLFLSILSILLLSTMLSYAQTPSAVTYPHKIYHNEHLFLDIDGDGTVDYTVRHMLFDPSLANSTGELFDSDESFSVCVIEGGGDQLSSVASDQLALTVIMGNVIIVEFVNLFPSDQSSQASNLPLSNAPLARRGPGLCKLLSYGDIIGPTPTIGSDWYNNAVIYSTIFHPVGAPLTGNSYEDGLLSGYIGVFFNGTAGWTYGWINIEIAADKSWVQINSYGYSPTADTPVPAGLGDPFAVPFSILATLFGFVAIGGGIVISRRNKKK